MGSFSLTVVASSPDVPPLQCLFQLRCLVDNLADYSGQFSSLLP
jgi:hypothetical protein